MNKSTRTRSLQLLAGAALMMAAGLSHAQYVWVNEKGVRQISDKAPPASVPAKNILRTPSGVPEPLPQVNPVPAATGAPAFKSNVPKTAAEEAAAAANAKLTPDQIRLAEREADYKKRMKEAADKEARDKEERKVKEAKRAACDSAKEYKATLDTNQPVTTVSASGEPVFMGDEQRKKLGDQAQKVIDDCKR